MAYTELEACAVSIDLRKESIDSDGSTHQYHAISDLRSFNVKSFGANDKDNVPLSCGSITTLAKAPSRRPASLF